MVLDSLPASPISHVTIFSAKLDTADCYMLLKTASMLLQRHSWSVSITDNLRALSLQTYSASCKGRPWTTFASSLWPAEGCWCLFWHVEICQAGMQTNLMTCQKRDITHCLQCSLQLPQLIRQLFSVANNQKPRSLQPDSPRMASGSGWPWFISNSLFSKA